jgi:hypothetical protein
MAVFDTHFDAQPTPLRVLTSLPRSGTHWLKRMVSDVLGTAPLERRLLDPADLRDALETEASRRLIYEHFDFDAHAPLLNPDARPGLRMLLLYRNPVDAAISGFHRFAVQGWLPDENADAVENFRLYVRGHWVSRPLPERCRVAFPMLKVSFREWIRGRVVGWYRSGRCLPLRYEDLLTDTHRQLERALDHLCIPHDAQTVDQAVQRNTFRTLSGGRDPGTVDPRSHYRRGIPGEWREALDPDDVEIVHREIGDYLALLGYPMEVGAAAGGAQPRA